MKFLWLAFFALSCAQAPSSFERPIAFYDFDGRPEGTVSVEAFSGLYYSGKDQDGALTFWSHTDRGPNLEPLKELRPFVAPDFQPRLTQFRVKAGEKRAHYVLTLPLFLPDGRRMTGLPNFAPAKGRVGDETPVDLRLKPLPMDPMGIDPEAVCHDGEFLWLAEEYGPSILKFDMWGTLITRYVPQGHWQGERPYYVKEVLPAVLLTRKMNRGFEGIACHGGKVWATIQSPLPDDGKNIHIVELDTRMGQVTQSFYYPLESMDADKIGDLSYHDGKLLVLEQNSKTGPTSFHRVYSISLSEARPGAILTKTLLVDLVKAGFDFAEKVEGIAMVDDTHLAVVNDNDFGLAGGIDSQARALMDPTRTSRLAIIRLK